MVAQTVLHCSAIEIIIKGALGTSRETRSISHAIFSNPAEREGIARASSDASLLLVSLASLVEETNCLLDLTVTVSVECGLVLGSVHDRLIEKGRVQRLNATVSLVSEILFQ